MKANQLDLQGQALECALAYEAAFPDASFTSGRRTAEDQARAMSQNCAVNHKWIEQTYAHPLCPAAVELQAWLDKNPKSSAPEIRVSFIAILKAFPDNELSKLSKHLSGNAFDAAVDSDERKDNWLEAEAKKRGGKFLRKEGGLRRRHWQA